MMKLRRIILLIAFLPLLLCCGGKEPIHDLPAPPTPVTPPSGGGEEGGSGEGGGGDTPSGDWDKNRGKKVTPSGTGWTTTQVREGIIFYKFTGKDPITNSMQNVCAVTVDLNNSDYAVKLTYTNPSATTSTVHKNHNAIATMNAGYEAGSIYIRVGTKDKSALPNIKIGDTGVLNWKSEAGFFGNQDRALSIKKADNPLIRPYVSPAESEMSKFISAERNFYYNCTDADIISSSPLLIYDYEPVGETFIDYSYPNWDKLNSEHPQYHQRKRHPRSAVAITEDNRFIMMVVDGRQTNFASGMSAKELTQFFVTNFNPQYALNMDGGGSTAMCVEGLGNKDTHIVDSPIQDNVPGKERARDTHFIIVAK